MNRNLYVLDGHEPRLAQSLLEWGKWYSTADRQVALTRIDSLEVSTVFLGIDHAFSAHGARDDMRPILFETAIFVGESVARVFRYPSWDDAERAHAFIIGCLQDAIHKRQLGLTEAVDETMGRWLEYGANEHGDAT